MIEPYYADDSVTLYRGDCRDVIPALGLVADCIVTDPPYAETSLEWDRWPDGWPTVAASAASSMWCFGSMRMFMDRRDEFADWHMSQDVVWEKHNGSGLAVDRFKRVHEHAVHWYRGMWQAITHEVPAERVDEAPRHLHRAALPQHQHGERRSSGYAYDGSRLMRSVIRIRSMHGRAIHPTEKPVGIVDPLIRYACPRGGLVLDPFAGSGSTAAVARMSGRRAVLIEGREDYCELIAGRLSQDVLPLGEVS